MKAKKSVPNLPTIKGSKKVEKVPNMFKSGMTMKSKGSSMKSKGMKQKGAC